MTDPSREKRPSRIGPKIAVDRNLPFHESLVHMLWHAVEGRAVIYQGRSITYREFGRASNGLMALLASHGLGTGLEPGPIVIMMPNSIEMDVALMAVMSVGAQVAPVNPFLTVAEICKVIDGFGAKAIVCDQSTRDKANAVAEKIGITHMVTVGDGGESLVRWISEARLDARPAKMPRADDLALSIFTGGTTGIPKGVDHTHRGLMWGLIQHVSVWPIPSAKAFFSMLRRCFISGA